MPRQHPAPRSPEKRASPDASQPVLRLKVAGPPSLHGAPDRGSGPSSPEGGARVAILHRISGVARTFCTGMGVEQVMIRMQWHLNDAPGRESVPGVGGVVLLN